MRTLISRIVIFLMITASIIACTEDQNLKSEKKEMTEFLKQKQSEVENALEELKIEAVENKEDAKQDYDLLIKKLKKSKAEITVTLAEINEAGRENFQEVKGHVEKLTNEVDESLKELEINISLMGDKKDDEAG